MKNEKDMTVYWIYSEDPLAITLTKNLEILKKEKEYFKSEVRFWLSKLSYLYQTLKESEITDTEDLFSSFKECRENFQYNKQMFSTLEKLIRKYEKALSVFLEEESSKKRKEEDNIMIKNTAYDFIFASAYEETLISRIKQDLKKMKEGKKQCETDKKFWLYRNHFYKQSFKDLNGSDDENVEEKMNDSQDVYWYIEMHSDYLNDRIERYEKVLFIINNDRNLD